MGYYQMLWEERKRFLKSSCILGAIIAIVLTIVIGKQGISSVSDFFELILVFVVFSLFFIAVVAVARMIFGGGSAGGNFAIGAVNGLWMATLNAFTGSMLGIAIGLCMLFFFIILFGIVAAIYTIYLPISSIYYFIKARQENAGAVESV